MWSPEWHLVRGEALPSSSWSRRSHIRSKTPDDNFIAVIVAQYGTTDARSPKDHCAAAEISTHAVPLVVCLARDYSRRPNNSSLGALSPIKMSNIQFARKRQTPAPPRQKHGRSSQSSARSIMALIVTCLQTRLRRGGQVVRQYQERFASMKRTDHVLAGGRGRGCDRAGQQTS